MNNDLFYKVIIGALLLAVIWFGFRLESIKRAADQQNEHLKKSIIASDSLIKESSGQYAKLVDYYNSSKDLNKQLKDSNEELYKTVKSQNERILSLTRTVFTLREELVEGFGKFNPADSNTIELALQYPTDTVPFIHWDGLIDRKTAAYRGSWTFGQLPIQIIVTEDTRGLWKHRIVGPDWFIVDSLTVNSLPPEKYTATTDRSLKFLVGGGYQMSLDRISGSDLRVGAGISIKNRHNLIMDASTDRKLGVNYYYQFSSTKKTR